MPTDDLLADWLFVCRIEQEEPAATAAARQRAQADGRRALQRLAAVLDGAPPGKVNYDRVSGGLPISRYGRYLFAEESLAEVERRYLEVWERGGNSSSHVLEGLTQALALARSPAAIPFWLKLLDLSRPRDQGTTKRRDAALAALALRAIMDGDARAETALIDALGHPHEQVRALAAYYLGSVYLEAEREPPPAALIALQERVGDRAFAPRFQARLALRDLGYPQPLDHPDHVYFCEVRLGRHPATRTIAIRSEQTLSDLHYAIQRAFGWDADHLYSFFLSGDREDQRYVIDCPELDESGNPGRPPPTAVYHNGVRTVVGGNIPAQGDDADDDGPLCTTSAQIGALGLVPNHKFTYFFDYGDSHHFSVVVRAVEPCGDDGDYPRLVGSKGSAPEQYSWGEEE